MIEINDTDRPTNNDMICLLATEYENFLRDNEDSNDGFFCMGSIFLNVPGVFYCS